jgi:hypothetical protein
VEESDEKVVARERNNIGGWPFCFSVAEPRRCRLDNAKMRLLIAVIIIIYLVGVGVILAPTVTSTWSSEPASAFAESVAEALPDALAWPIRAARNVRGS